MYSISYMKKQYSFFKFIEAFTTHKLADDKIFWKVSYNYPCKVHELLHMSE